MLRGERYGEPMSKASTTPSRRQHSGEPGQASGQLYNLQSVPNVLHRESCGAHSLLRGHPVRREPVRLYTRPWCSWAVSPTPTWPGPFMLPVPQGQAAEATSGHRPHNPQKHLAPTSPTDVLTGTTDPQKRFQTLPRGLAQETALQQHQEHQGCEETSWEPSVPSTSQRCLLWPHANIW